VCGIASYVVSDLEFRHVGPDAPDIDIERWHAAYVRSDSFGRADACPYRLPELVDMIRETTSYRWFGAWTAHRAGELVAVGFVETPLADNLHLASVEVQVLPEFRRQGIGSALLAHLEEEARARGRDTALAEVCYPLEAPEDGAGSVAGSFAAARGFDFALGDIQRRCTLPIDAELLDRLAADAASHHAGYRLETFVGAVPDQWVSAVAEMAGSLVVEAPMGDLDMEAEDTSVAGWRDREAGMARQGLTAWKTIALDPSGTPVAYTSIAVSAHDASLCHQWGTLVVPAHRGHRLGLAVKVANHRALQAASVVPHEVVTWNAAVNEHMIGVNDLLGFHRVGRLGEFQKRL
jgi:GNAT superfamily N-acetyltransferase